MLFHLVVVCLVACFIGLFINAAEAYEQDKKNSPLEKFRRDVKVRRMREKEARISEVDDKITGIFVESVAKASINGLGKVLTK